MEYGQQWEADASDVYVSTSDNIHNALECQKLCQNPTEKYQKKLKGKACKLFAFNGNGKCILKSQWTNKKYDSGVTSIIGKKKCSGQKGENFCNSMHKEWYYNLLDNLPDYQGE